MIIHKSAHSPGCHHDYKIYKSKHPIESKKLLQRTFTDHGHIWGLDVFQTKSILGYKTRRAK